jgi:hypothetical protein
MFREKNLSAKNPFPAILATEILGKSLVMYSARASQSGNMMVFHPRTLN